ncbi:MAG: chemotaxis protein CheA, partial [Candidatus Omnitrophota bacterium]
SEQNSGLSQQKSAQGRASSGVKTAPVEVSIIKIDSRKLDDLMNFSGELVIIKAQFARLVNLFKNEIVQQKSSIQINEHFRHSIDVLSKEIETYSSFENKAKTVKIKKIISELSELANLANENILKSNIVENIHSIDETTGALEKVSSNIQAGIMQTRMVPVEGVFTRFKRIVRDISKKIGKDVNLVIEGAETELDKKIVDELGDPLTHMIRNAVGHGMEDKEERAKTGKPLTGSVFLRASHKGNNICIEIGDDGRGVDTEKLVASAIRKGLVTQEDADKMNEKEKLNIMFMPGFSTAQEVTGLSGRGVGMDVVKNMINSVNGVVDINTEIGKGTTFALKIPLTLAIIQSLLVAVGEEIYAFPLDSVVEIINIFDQDIYSINGNPMVKLRGHALSLISLERAIKVKGSHKQGNDAKKVVIITDGENKVGVIVDCLIGKDEIVIKSFSEHFSNVLGLTGASILADGSVALILDSAAIIKEVK